MNRAPDSSKLEAFLRDTLKGTDDKFQPFDWSELEVLLKPEQRTIAVPVNKKNMFMAAAVGGVLVLIFIIFQLTQYYSSLPAEPETPVDTAQTTFSVLDTTSTAAPDSSALPADSVKVDSTAFLAAEKRKVDSLTALRIADSIAKIKVEVLPAVKAKDKKKKTDTTQKVNAVDTASAKPPVDTTSRPAPKEIIAPAPAVTDTASKKPAAENNGGKKKKTKAKKPVTPPAEPKTDPPVVPSDSLK